MRAATIIERLEQDDAKVVPHAEAKIANPQVCDFNKSRIADALDAYRERNVVATTPEPAPEPEHVDPVAAAQAAADKALRRMAWSAREASIAGGEVWEDFLAGTIEGGMAAEATQLNAVAKAAGKVTYRQALAAIGGTPAAA